MLSEHHILGHSGVTPTPPFLQCKHGLSMVCFALVIIVSQIAP